MVRLRQLSCEWRHWILVLCTLLAFARLVTDLGGKTIWWDESLSLQRSEQGWGDLLLGKLALWDGDRERITWDQHPPAFYVLLGLLLRAGPDSAFVLRFVSAFAATLIVPACYGFTGFLRRKQLAPAGAPYWAAGLAALNPFSLWYGQEARPYALWMLCSLLAVWFLWEWLDTWKVDRGKLRQSQGWGWLYFGALLLSLTTHFYSILMLPIHGFLIAVYLLRVERKAAVELMTFVVLLSGTMAFMVYRFVMSQPGAGSNFPSISLGRVVQELLHSFGSGLSVRADQMGWLGYVFLALAGYGVFYAMRTERHRKSHGWFPMMYLLAPVASLFAFSFLQANYMAARHHAQLLGMFLALTASGLAALFARQKWAAVGCTLLLLGGGAYSSWSYYTHPMNGKAPDYALVGSLLEDRIRSGDIVIFKGPNSWRLFRYYFPMEEIEEARDAGHRVDWKGMPAIRTGPLILTVQDYLAFAVEEYDRVWMLEDRTLPYEDPDSEMLHWLRDNMHQHRDWRFFHPNSSLDLYLFLPENPNPVAAIPDSASMPIGAVFGDAYRLEALGLGKRLWDGGHLPLDLYWQVLDPPSGRHRYIAWLQEVRPDGSRFKMPHTEQYGYFPESPTAEGGWRLSFTHVEAPETWRQDSEYLLHVMIYEEETLSRMPVSEQAGFQLKEDEPALVIPLQLKADDLS